MSAISISLIVLACVFGGSLLGMALRQVLPKEHLSGESSTTIRLAMGLVITMSGIVVGMLVSTARNTYNARYQELIATSADILMLDRLLADYGPEAQDVRSELRSTGHRKRSRVYSAEYSRSRQRVRNKLS
jgi:hypothetical protein